MRLIYYYPEITAAKVFVVGIDCMYRGYHAHFTRIYSVPTVITRPEIISPQRNTRNVEVCVLHEVTSITGSRLCILR